MNRSFKSIAVQTVAAVLLILPRAVDAATVALVPSADTSLFEASRFNNLGGVTNLISGNTGVGRSRAILKFDVAAGIPGNAVVTSARLVLQVTKLPATPADSDFALHRMLISWGEGEKGGTLGAMASPGESTWDERFFSTATWSSPGAAAPVDFSPVVSASMFVSGLGGYEFANLLSDVELWRSNPGTNFGWILLSQVEDNGLTARRFGARESIPSERPRLVVEYEIPDGVASMIPVADTTLFEFTPDNNLGSAILASGLTAVPSRSRALMRFDVSSGVPAGASVLAVSLKMTVVLVPGPNGPLVPSNFGLHRLLVPWNEGNKVGFQGQLASAGEATWNQRSHSFVTPTPWSAPGAAAPVDYSSTISGSGFVTGLGAYNLTGSGLATDVQAWLTTPGGNLGWIMISDAEDQMPSACRFGSRESATASERPLLTVSYKLSQLPHIESADVNGSDVNIHFNASAGFSYVVQCRDDLNSPGWLTCTNLPVQGVTGPVTVTLPIMGTQKFFRIGRQ